jgi:sugar phosphate isomerase/epimerase
MPVRRVLSLAAGTVLDVAPDRAVAVAAEAGFDAVGLWFDPESWDDRTTRAVHAQLDATGLAALDVEPVILGRGADHGERIVDLAGELGAAHVLVASGGAPPVEVAGRLAQLASRAAPGVALVLEFLPIFTVASLPDALDVVSQVQAPNLGVLVDTLHLDRSGGRPDDLLAADRSAFPYLQLADAHAGRPSTTAALRDEALHGRLLPGRGVLPLVEVLAAVPAVPVSVELRGRRLAERYPDPVARARVVRAATERVLVRRDGAGDMG